MKEKTPKPIATRLGLYVTTERDRSYGDYFHIKAQVVTIGTTAYERRMIDEGRERPRNIENTSIRNVGRDLVGGLHLDGFKATCQGTGGDTPRHLYAFETRYYDMHTIDLDDAKRMAGTLTIIHKRMDDLTKKYGYPTSFGQYLARVADAVRADSFVFPRTDENSRGRYADHEHRIWEIASGIYQVDQLADAWIREDDIAREKAETAARMAALEPQSIDA